jgi:hypothetical protein
LERAVACPASFALPQIRETTGATEGGTANHSAIEADLSSGSTSDRKVVRDALDGAIEVLVEAAFALDVEKETVRYLGSRIGRNYGERSVSEIALTVDAVVIRPDSVWVWDWKSRKRVTPAARNMQLRAGGIAAMKYLERSSVSIAIGYLDNDEVDASSVDLFDAPTFFERMRETLSAIAKARKQLVSGETPTVHSGSWCEYCPALAYCPAQTRLAKAMLDELGDVNQQVELLTAEQAGKAWTRLKQFQSLADRVEASLRLRAKRDVVPLPNGKRLALVECSRSSFDKRKALAWIAEHGGDPKAFEGRTFYEQIKEVNMGESNGK